MKKDIEEGYYNVVSSRPASAWSPYYGSSLAHVCFLEVDAVNSLSLRTNLEAVIYYFSSQEHNFTAALKHVQLQWNVESASRQDLQWHC